MADAERYRRLHQRAVGAGALGPLGQTRPSSRSGELTDKARPSISLFKLLQPRPKRSKPKKTEGKSKSKPKAAPKPSAGSKGQQEPPEAKRLRQLMWSRYEQENG